MAECTCADPSAVANAIGQQSSKISDSIGEASTKIDETLYGKALSPGGQHGAPAPVRFCHWAAPEVSDVGENAWASAFRAASVAIAIANGLAQAEIADKQQDLAESWYSQAKYKWDRFAGKYMQLEKKLLNEVSSVPIRKMDCADADMRASSAVNTAYDSIGDFISRRAKAMRMCIDPSLLSVVDSKRALMLVDAENYNLVDELWYTDYKNDQRWNRRSNVLNLGRNLSSEAMKYGDVARQLYGQVGQQIDRAAQGVMQALGYYGARNDTYYPTTFLSGGSGQLVSIGQPTGVNPATGMGEGRG